MLSNIGAFATCLVALLARDSEAEDRMGQHLVVKAQLNEYLLFLMEFSIHFEGMMMLKVGHAKENVGNDATEQVAKMTVVEAIPERMVALDALVILVASLEIMEMVEMAHALDVE